MLLELQRQAAMKPSLEVKLTELQHQRQTFESEVTTLRAAFRKEQADVERLEGRSLANYFYQVVGRLDEKLDQDGRRPMQQRSRWMQQSGSLPELRLICNL